MINDCLGIGLNCSNYDISFNIVGLLTIVGLFFAGYQLIKPVNKLRLNYSLLSPKCIYVTIVLSIFISTMPIILKFIPGKPLPILGYDIFWEILSLFIIITIGLILFFIVILPIRKIDSKKFLSLLMGSLGQGDRAISAIGSEFPNFIVDLIKNVDNRNEDAFLSLILCENKYLVKYIVEDINCFNALLSVYYKKFKDEGDYNLNDLNILRGTTLNGELFNVPVITDGDVCRLHKEFLNLIITESLNNENSILSKELNGEIYKGINKGYGLVSKQIFNNFGFIHKYNLLNDKGGLFKDNSNTYNDNYIKFWELCLESFFDRDNQEKFEKNMDYHNDLYLGICNFCGYKSILNKKCEKLEILYSPVENLDIKLSHFNDLILKKCMPNNSHYYKITEQGEFHPLFQESKDFIESISWGCFKLLESLSYIKETTENEWAIRHLSCEIYMNNFTDSIVIKRIQENLKNLMRGHIEKTNGRGFYPNMTRIFFHIFGRYIFFGTINEEDEEFIISVLKIVSKALKNFSEGRFWFYNGNNISMMDDDLIESRDKKIMKIMEDYLPKNMIYRKDNHTLVYYSGERLEKKILDLNILDNLGIIQFC